MKLDRSQRVRATLTRIFPGAAGLALAWCDWDHLPDTLADLARHAREAHRANREGGYTADAAACWTLLGELHQLQTAINQLGTIEGDAALEGLEQTLAGCDDQQRSSSVLRARQRVTDDAAIRRFIATPNNVAGLVDDLPGRKDGWAVAMALLLAALADIWRALPSMPVRSASWVTTSIRNLALAFDRATVEQDRALSDVVIALGGDPFAIRGLHPKRATDHQCAQALGRVLMMPDGRVFS